MTLARERESNATFVGIVGVNLSQSSPNLATDQVWSSGVLYLPIICPMIVLPALTLPTICWEQNIVVAYIKELASKNRVRGNNAFLFPAFLTFPLQGSAWHTMTATTTPWLRMSQGGSIDYGIFHRDSYTWYRHAKIQEKNYCHVACSGTVLICILRNKDTMAANGISTHFLL